MFIGKNTDAQRLLNEDVRGLAKVETDAEFNKVQYASTGTSPKVGIDPETMKEGQVNLVNVRTNLENTDKAAKAEEVKQFRAHVDALQASCVDAEKGGCLRYS